MKEEKVKTKNKRGFIYYLILGVIILLLIAATVLTVYFVTTGRNSSLENNPNIPENPDNPDDPNQPSSGEAAFVLPVDYNAVVTVFNEQFENLTMEGWIYRHEGLDFTAPVGTEVRSIAAGTVTYFDAHTELGNLIVVDHGEGLKSYYYFCEPVLGLAVGDTVEKGQKIGTVAESYGFEEFLGSHLHLEIELNGNLADPADYLQPVLEEK